MQGMKTGTKTSTKVILNILLVIYAIFALFPLVWMVILSFKSDAQMYNTTFIFTPTLDNYKNVLLRSAYPDIAGNACNLNGKE